MKDRGFIGILIIFLIILLVVALLIFLWFKFPGIKNDQTMQPANQPGQNKITQPPPLVSPPPKGADPSYYVDSKGLCKTNEDCTLDKDCNPANKSSVASSIPNSCTGQIRCMYGACALINK